MMKILIFSLLLLLVSLISMDYAFAEPIIYFNAQIYDLSTGPIILTVDDSLNPEFTDIPNRHSKLDSALLQMEIEDKKAQEYLKQYFEKIYPGIKYR